LAAAVRAAGGYAKLAKRMGVTPQAVWQWPECPPLRVLDVERATGIPRHELRPDIYPAPEASDAA
jgi:DNA-binding transcriptional regulator YdaS (Cro superfamily)